MHKALELGLHLRLFYVRNINSFIATNIMSEGTVGDNEGTLSKRALKRLHRRRVYEAAKEGKKTEKKAKMKDLKEESDLIHDECLHETDYYFENGLRKVYPYYYTFTAHAKGRWFGLRLVDVFVKEFQNYTLERCRKSIESGIIQVNDRPTCVDHVIKNGDFIVNRVHRHELSITAEAPAIIVNDDEFLVVDKPSSIPIHPCGRYRHNSLLYILAKEHGFRNLRSLYRLDRLTSGLVIFCKTEEKTREMMKCIAGRKVEKEYLCKVEGIFPSEALECSRPIGPLSQKFGIYKTDESGKASTTTFERVAHDGATSVVKCRPHTGRTHQIRVHLQYLGFPIINDPLYNGTVWGPNKGKNGDYGQTDEELIQGLMKLHSSSLYLDELASPPGECPSDEVTAPLPPGEYPSNPSPPPGEYPNNNCIAAPPPGEYPSNDKVYDVSKAPLLDESADSDDPPTKRSHLDDGETTTFRGPDRPKAVVDEDCRECKLRFVDPRPDQLVMYLHAFKYKGPGWEFSTSLPDWAATTTM